MIRRYFDGLFCDEVDAEGYRCARFRWHGRQHCTHRWFHRGHI